jgi:hypothetical protein
MPGDVLWTIKRASMHSNRICTLAVVGETPKPDLSLMAKALLIHEVIVSGAVASYTASPLALKS